MNKEELYLIVPPIILGFFIFICVIVSLIFNISFVGIILISIVITTSLIGGIYYYRKNNNILSSTEKNMESIVLDHYQQVYDYFEDQILSLHRRITYDPEKMAAGSNYLSGDLLVEWSAESIKELDLKRFKILCGGFLKFHGLNAVAATEADGIDFKIIKPTYSQTKPVAIVQSMIGDNGDIGMDKLQQLIEVMAAFGVKTAFLFTNGQFAADALAFAAKNKGIRLFDGKTISDKIQKLTEQQKQALLNEINVG